MELNSRFYTYVNLESSKSVSAYITDSRTMQTNEQHSNLCCETPKRRQNELDYVRIMQQQQYTITTKT